MILRPPHLGPIIGHTTGTNCRLWIRGGDPGDEGAHLASARRTVGVIGVMKGATVERAYYFRTHREFDRTGTFVLGVWGPLGCTPEELKAVAPLTPDTSYTIRMATLTVDDPTPDDESIPDADLARRLPPIDQIAPDLALLDPDKCEATFRTFPEVAGGDSAASLAFLLGSCRYPGLLWKIKDADRIFGPMRDHLEARGRRPAARFSLMVGDQIYADMFNRLIPIGLADTYQEFQDRYHQALGSNNMRALLKTAPTYMTLDDHEIEDNWTQDRLEDPGKHRLFNLAIGAYMSYQWSHGPRTHGRLLYYDFECAGYPFFVLDTRTQRFKAQAGLEDNHLLGRPTIDPAHPSQLDRLLGWLDDQQKRRGDVPKFIVSSGVFAPSAIKERLDPNLKDDNRRLREASDSWPAFPETRKRLVEHLVANTIQNVVFLSGDIHCSNIARLRFSGSKKAKQLVALSVTSSAFYWPFPFADGDPNNFVHDSTKAGQLDSFPFQDGKRSCKLDYEAFAFTQVDNFCRLEVDKAKAELRVRIYDRDGDPVTSGGAELDNRLQLKPWG